MAIGIERGMETIKEINGRGCMVAVPYYGSLIRPHSGLETLYLMAEVNRATGTVETLNVRVWNTIENPDLPGWLKAEGIEAIICEDFQPKLEKSFQDRGVSTCWNHKGEMEEAVLRMFSEPSERSAGDCPDN